MNTRELSWLRRLRDLSQMLGSEQDPKRLPPLILDSALELTGAERAFLVRVEGPDTNGNYKLSVLAGRGFTHDALSGPEGALSRTVVERALTGQGQAVITTREEDRDILHASSIAGSGIRSVVCVPLRLRGSTIGVLYLDHRGEEGLFHLQDLPTLQTFATQAALSLELARAQPAEASGRPAQHLVGESATLKTLLEEVQRVSSCDDPILVCGEVGTELGLTAREIHAQSAEARSRMQILPCGGDPSEEARRLLGGDGAPGRLGIGTTVVLEQVEAMGPDLQRVLARALQTGTYTPPASSERIAAAARIIALSHASLAELVVANRFRADLYYQLDVQRLVVPPLRQRREDLPALCEAFFRRQGTAALSFDPDAMRRLREYGWPGNMLELERELRRLSGKVMRVVTAADLSQDIREGRGVIHKQADFTGRTMEELQEELVRATIKECGGVKARAARQLGIPRSTLYHLLARYGIS